MTSQGAFQLPRSRGLTSLTPPSSSQAWCDVTGSLPAPTVTWSVSKPGRLAEVLMQEVSRGVRFPFLLLFSGQEEILFQIQKHFNLPSSKDPLVYYKDLLYLTQVSMFHELHVVSWVLTSRISNAKILRDYRKLILWRKAPIPDS